MRLPMEYFIHAESFAAPFCSDTLTRFVEAPTPTEALDQFVHGKPHPCGIYSAVCYTSSDDFHKGKTPLAKYLSNKALALQVATAGKGAYVMQGRGAGAFEVDGQLHRVPNPRDGRVVYPPHFA